MAADPTIRAALDQASVALRQSLRSPDTCAYESICGFSPCACAHNAAAAAVAAFHRRRAQDCRAAGMMPSAMLHDDLAAAVEEAARHG